MVVSTFLLILWSHNEKRPCNLFVILVKRRSFLSNLRNFGFNDLFQFCTVACCLRNVSVYLVRLVMQHNFVCTLIPVQYQCPLYKQVALIQGFAVLLTARKRYHHLFVNCEHCSQSCRYITAFRIQ